MSLTLLNQILETMVRYRYISIALTAFIIGVITGMILYPTKRIVADLATWYTAFSKSFKTLNHLSADDYHYIKSEVLLLVMNMLASRYSDRSFTLSKNYLKSKNYKTSDVNEIIRYIDTSVYSFIETYTVFGWLKRLKRNIRRFFRE